MIDNDRFRKYLPKDEKILAVIKSGSVLGVKGYYCATERRVGELWRGSLFSWSYRSIEYDMLSHIEI